MNGPALPNPFVGLRPFEAEESLLFFGRREQTVELLRRLNDNRFVAVVGSSGCGKSSLVRAGLIPRLQAGFLVQDRDSWCMCKMKPGDAPITHLASALLASLGGDAITPGQVQDYEQSIRDEGIQGLINGIGTTVTEQDSNVLILVDQFEELFRVELSRGAGPSDDATDFVSLILDAATQRTLPIYVIITMRSDFLGDCDRFPGLPEALNTSQYLVPRLSRQQRREAIEGPIQLFGGEIAPRLTDRLLNETIDTRDDLPVLQHALMRVWDLWSRERDGPIDLSHYEAIGTLHEALSRDAEAALESFDSRQLLLTQRLFQALTTVDAGKRCVRRPAKLNHVLARTGATQDEIWTIIQKFRGEGRSFLVVSNEDPASDPLIDISHESLIRQWARLGKWAEEEAQAVKTYLRLVESALLYKAGKANLYQDLDLRGALDWERDTEPNAAWAKAYHDDFALAVAFLRESKAVRDITLAEAEFARRWQRPRRIILALVAALLLFNLGSEAIRNFWEGVDNAATELSKNWASLEGLTSSQHGRSINVFNTLAEIFRFGMHVLLYLGLVYVGKPLYRNFTFDKVTHEIASGTGPLAELKAIAKTYAGFWRRLGALLIDALICGVAVVTLIFSVILVASPYMSNPDVGGAIAVICFLGLPWLYESLFLRSSHQATPGKMVLGIVVTDMNGHRISWLRGLVRSSIKLVLLFLVPWILLLQPLSRRKQALHDFAARTLVYSARGSIPGPSVLDSDRRSS